MALHENYKRDGTNTYMKVRKESPTDKEYEEARKRQDDEEYTVNKRQQTTFQISRSEDKMRKLLTNVVEKGSPMCV